MESPLVKFLTRRELFCKSALDLVCVDGTGGGAVVECVGNAHSQLRHQDLTIVSGWLAEPRQHLRAHRKFTQHCWNFDQLINEYFDTTPAIEMSASYILDRDTVLFAIDNNARLSGCVCCSVVYSSGGFYTMEYASNGYDLQPAQDLSTERLFASFLQPKTQVARQESASQINPNVALTH